MNRLPPGVWVVLLAAAFFCGRGCDGVRLPDLRLPGAPRADAELVAKFRGALAADGPQDRDAARKLAAVYLAAAKRAETEPMTVGALYTVTFNASVYAGVPRRDSALGHVRGVIDSLTTIKTGAPADAAVVALWVRIGTALAEAAE